MSHERETIKRRLQALMRLAENAGATEAEATRAAEAAARLMMAHGLTYRTADEIAAEEWVTAERPWFAGRHGRRRGGRKPSTRHALHGISRVCGVEYCWRDSDGALLFFGDSAGVAAAHDLTALIARAIRHEWAVYASRTPARDGTPAITRRLAFEHAMAVRIGARLEMLATAARPTGSGTELLSLRDATVARAFGERFAPRNVKGSATARDRDAARAGADAGNRTSLGPARPA